MLQDKMKKYKIVVYVPEPHADKLRDAMGNAGAGKIGTIRTALSPQKA